MASTIEAAGVVLLRRGRRGLEVCVVHRPRHQDWSLPKGKRDPGELLQITAWREAVEETGIHVHLGVPLPTQTYRVDGRPKTVDYWVASAARGGPGFRPNKEIDGLEWVSVQRARARLTYARDRRWLLDAAAVPRTSPLIVLRHTAAMRRSDYKGSKDWRRPLTKSGKRHAKEIAALLAAYGVAEVRTSDSKRCMQSVRPYAKAAGLSIIEEALFSEEIFDRRPKTALRRMAMIGRRPSPQVLCTHRPVLPDVLAAVAQQFGLKASMPKLSPSLEPGAMIVIHRELGPRGRPNGRAVAVERIVPE
ncbi:MAG: NUDIX domain-containing protein [Candidatus Nanopelagicales bacterium]